MIKLIAIICLVISTICFILSMCIISKIRDEIEQKRIADEIAKTYSEMKDIKINRGDSNESNRFIK